MSQSMQDDSVDQEQSGQPRSIFLRGTTGSGEQEAVFDEGGLGDGEDDDSTDPVLTATAQERDTSDPVAQLQGRSLPAQPEPPVLDPLRTDDPGPRSNVSQAQSQQGTGAVPQQDPFAANGFRIGSWRAFVTAEQTLGYSSNAQGVAMGDGSGFSQTDLSLSLQSNWSRHSARLDANGSWRMFLEDENEDLPSASVAAGLTLDLVDGVRAETALTYDYTTESATGTNINSAAKNRPGVHSFEAATGVARSDRKLVYSLRGSVGRTDYEAIKLTGGGEESQGDRNNTLYTLSGRIGYQTSPAFTPFIEGSVGRRIHDLEKDRNDEDRDSTILAAAVGTSIDISEKLQGEIAIGYQNERFEEESLEDLEGWTLNGNLTWSPVRETTINMNASTSFSGSTTSGQSGSIINSFGVSAERQVNSRLSLNADAGVELSNDRDGSRSDLAYSIGGGFNYWINRFMGLTGRVEHSAQRSSEGPPQEFDETTFRGGLRLQH